LLPITEQDSLYPNLSSLDLKEIISAINSEDQKVAIAVEKEIHFISNLVENLVQKMESGGRLFYIGAGTSGRLGILDASECPPTYGVPHGLVIGIIAGGDSAIRKAVEFAEDNTDQAIKDLMDYGVNENDFVVGLSASGNTPYVFGGLMACRTRSIKTACICCAKGSKIGSVSDFPVEVEVGPEIITGSTRMKAGTAQKMVLNMITSAAMVKLGKVEGSKMVNMQLSNHKLIDRGTRMVVEQTGLDYEKSKFLLIQFGSVKLAVEFFKSNL
jgi:N-acetylmuramic acid 6-phosphate etherase